MDASYCVSITAFGFDGQTATVERCFDRADLPALPADVGAVTGTDRRTECIPPDEPDMGTADMDAPDMSEPDMDTPDMSGADMAADMDAPDMSEPGPKTTTSGDGGCTTPGGTSPIAPAAMLAALGLVGWLRRRRS
jgi:MYXO-CTERM domain-containing protein